MTRRRTWTLFLASMVVSAGVCSAAKAHAVYSRFNAQACWQNQSNATLAGQAAASGTLGYVFNSSTTSLTALFCPLPDNTAQPKNAYQGVNAHGRTATGITSPNASAQICVVFWDQLGADCNGGVSTTATGVWAITQTGGGVLTKTDSSHSGGFPYLSVILPRSGTADTNPSALFGYYVF
jgi:hypothetical protein